MIKIGDYVKWNDPCIIDYDEDGRKIQSTRVYEVYDINGEIISIADDYGEVEVFEDELVVVDNKN